MSSLIFHHQAKILKALSHPKRLEIINLIRDQKFCCVGTMHQMLDLAQSNVSQHLMILRDAGIVTTQKEGKNVYYQIVDKKVYQACDLLRDFLRQQPAKKITKLVTDPVCGMKLSTQTASFHIKHQHQDYYFCASGCLKKFKKDPLAFCHQITYSTN